MNEPTNAPEQAQGALPAPGARPEPPEWLRKAAQAAQEETWARAEGRERPQAADEAQEAADAPPTSGWTWARLPEGSWGARIGQPGPVDRDAWDGYEVEVVTRSGARRRVILGARIVAGAGSALFEAVSC